MTHVSAFTITVLLSAAVAASSQDVVPPSPLPLVDVGSRVRLRSNALAGQPRGLVVALDDNLLTLATDGGVPLKIPVSSVTSMDTSLGRKRRTLEGLALGVVSGALLGLSFKVDPGNCGEYSLNSCSRGEAVAEGAMGFGLIGAGVGALIKSDRWSAVRLRAGPALAARSRGAGAAITLRF
jgi:hypothetical protein